MNVNLANLMATIKRDNRSYNVSSVRDKKCREATRPLCIFDRTESKELNVQVFNVERVVLDELASRFNAVAH